MIPTKEEQEKYLNNLISVQEKQSIKSGYVDDGCTFKLTENQVTFIAKKYAKWYAEQVINHCAEVAECIDNGITDEYYNGDLKWCPRIEVDQLSILNIINEL